MIKLETLLEEGYTGGEIALRLGKDKTTIYRCLTKNSQADGTFDGKKAWEMVCARKQKANTHYRILPESTLEAFILEKIEVYWSPEQIAGVWKTDHGEPLAHETIYQYIYTHHPELVRLYLRRKGKKYQKQRKEKYQIDDRRMIDERPEEVEANKEIGHWEGDTIVGKHHKQGILTNVERKSGLLLATKVPVRSAEAILDATELLFETIPEEYRVSMTYDNGKEFAWHKLIEQSTKMTVYFAHPYSPWERGRNENTNGLLRQFIPKGTDLETVPEEQLQYYVHLLNGRPRKRHGYLTPYQVFQNELSQKHNSSCT